VCVVWDAVREFEKETFHWKRTPILISHLILYRFKESVLSKGCEHELLRAGPPRSAGSETTAGDDHLRNHFWGSASMRCAKCSCKFTENSIWFFYGNKSKSFHYK